MLKFATAGIALVYVALALSAAVTMRPRADEGFFASPALNLVQTGSMGTPILEAGHAFMKDIHQYTYWITPLDFLAQAVWYTAFGFSLLAMRTLSIAWALVALAAWYLIARRMSHSESLAVLAVALIGLDYNFIIGGSSGRMDMMAASLGFCALAAYLSLRERHFTAAVLHSNGLVAAAGLTHPVAGYLYFAGIVFLTFYYDRRRIGTSQVAAAAAPYLIAGAAWGWYILKDPAAFQAQFATNATMHGRLTGLGAPWMGFVHEVTFRYAVSFGLGPHSFGHSGPVYLKSLILLAFMTGIAGSILSRGIRHNKDYRALMWLTAIFFVLLSVLDGQKAYYYLIHIFPFYAVLTAVWVWRLWQRDPRLRPVIAACVAGVLALQAGAVLYHATRFTYTRTYDPAVTFLKATVPPARTIVGSASLGFGLNFPHNLVDDVRLGYFTGRKPDYVVVNEEYSQVFQDYEHNQPAIYDFIVNRLAGEYDRVYDRAGFQVYALRAGIRQADEPAGRGPGSSPHQRCALPCM